MSANDILELLPQELRTLNRMEREIALPYPAVLEAIDVLEAQGVLLTGWEPLASYADGGFGAYPAMGIGGLAGITIPDSQAWDEAVQSSADIHRSTILDEWETRATTPPVEGVQLIFGLSGRRGHPTPRPQGHPSGFPSRILCEWTRGRNPQTRVCPHS